MCGLADLFCLCGLRFLSSPQARLCHPFAHTERESACRSPPGGPVGRPCGCERILDGPLTADLPADFHQFLAELLQTAKLRNLLPGSKHGRITGQGFGYRLAVEFTGDAQVRTVAGFIGPSTMTTGFATATDGADDRAVAHVMKTGDGSQQSAATCFRTVQRVGYPEKECAALAPLHA